MLVKAFIVYILNKQYVCLFNIAIVFSSTFFNYYVKGCIMSSKVVLRKNGGFYSVYGDDAYILYYLLNYRIIGDKVGFPNSALNKVVNLLEDNHISFEVDGNVYYLKNRNKYKKILDLGKRKSSLDYRVNDIISKLDKLNEKDIDKILDCVESFYE